MNSHYSYRYVSASATLGLGNQSCWEIYTGSFGYHPKTVLLLLKCINIIITVKSFILNHIAHGLCDLSNHEINTVLDTNDLQHINSRFINVVLGLGKSRKTLGSKQCPWPNLRLYIPQHRYNIIHVYGEWQVC